MKITKQTGLFIVLGVSLAINVYIIGTVGVYAYKFRTIGEGSTWIEERLDRGEKRFLSQLEGDDQVLAQKVINERKPLLRDAFIELLDARRAVIDTLKTDAPNPQELARHLTQSQNAVDQLNINFHGFLRDVTLGLSDEGRQKIGDRLTKNRRAWRTER